MAINTEEELEHFVAWVEEAHGPQVARRYRQKARSRLVEGPLRPFVLLDAVLGEFEEGDTLAAKRGGRFRFDS